MTRFSSGKSALRLILFLILSLFVFPIIASSNKLTLGGVDVQDMPQGVISFSILDTDGDGIGNNEDPDDDNDGTSDAFDAFPLDSTEFLDTDSDGIGDNADTDDDNDGTLDTQDIFPIDDYQTALLDSDLATSPFGIVGFSVSAVEDPQLFWVLLQLTLT